MRGTARPSSSSSPDVGVISLASSRASVDLPEPLSPTTAVTCPGVSAQRHVVDRVHHWSGRPRPRPRRQAGAGATAVHREVLGEAARLQHGRVVSGAASAGAVMPYSLAEPALRDSVACSDTSAAWRRPARSDARRLPLELEAAAS